MQLSGPSRPPAHGGSAEQLVVLLHGYGADGQDLIELAPLLGRVLPKAAFIAPDAPFPCEGAPYGRQWFGIQGADAELRLAGTRLAASLVDSFLDETLAGLGLGDDRLLLIGFSQGTMLSLHVGLRRSRPPAGIVGFSGRLIAPELLAEEMTARPPVLLVHGDRDDLVPVESLHLAEEALGAAGVPVESHVCRGLGHGIDEAGLSRAAAFVRRLWPAG